MAVVAALGTAQVADAGHPVHYVPGHQHHTHHHRVMPGYPVYPGHVYPGHVYPGHTIRPRPVMPAYPVYPTYPGYVYPAPVYPTPIYPGPVYPRTGFGIRTNDFSLWLGR